MEEQTTPDYLQKFIDKHKFTSNYPLNPKNIPEFVFTHCLSKAVQPNVRHLKLCGCGVNYLGKAKEFALKIQKKLYDERQLIERDSDGKIWKLYEEKALKEDCWQLLEDKFKELGVRCPVELKTIFDFIVLYSSKYDLSDPDVWNIVEPLLNHKLAVDRYALYSNHNDFVMEHNDRFNNRIITINPVEELKLKYDRERVASVEKLNRMIEGSKSNVSISVDSGRVIDRENMYGNKQNPIKN